MSNNPGNGNKVPGNDDIEPVVLPPEENESLQDTGSFSGSSSGEARSPELTREEEKMGLFEKIMWAVILVFCFVWIFIPEPTDAVPILGWLDEGFAIMMVLTALDRFGIKIPFLEKLVLKGWGRKKLDRDEKDITPK